ncbi:MAG TPA: LysM peptidoglycan-binding domain-containing protein, partial [Candidatus Cloacimonas sp.]|nr:LysM peptidoglycan-binding domain-containing protein [Candidatus Cloacimonas sp.]
MTLKLDRLLWLLVMQILLILPLGLSAEDQIHIIKKGDTLYSLSKRYGTTVDELKRLNNLSDNNLSIGQKLIVKKDVKPSKPIVPVPVTKPATPEITESSSSPQISALPGSEINPSLSLEKKIPADYYYTVKAGDNLYRIAINHNIKLEELLAWNNFANSSIPIHPGDKLVIKNPAELPETKIVPEEVISEPNPAVATVPAKNDTVLIERVYVVQKKDTLYRIATNNGMTVEELMQLNNLTSPDLKVGQKLYLSGKPRPEPLPSPT